MNYKVLIMTLSSVTVGLVELIVGGVLPVIAEDFQVSIGAAGQLITVFALVYAISGPVLLSLTAKVERKKLYMIMLAIFCAGNILTYFSQTFTWMMIARVITAMSAALVIVLSLTITAKIVSPAHRAKSLGLIYMGVSSALVLGVPIGIVLTDALNWRIIFMGIAVLSIICLILIYKFLDRIPTDSVLPLSAQIRSLANVKIVSAHLAMAFMLAGHYTLYAYFTPFLKAMMNMNSYWISVSYFLFGVAAISGGALGGALADWMGSKKSILIVISSFAVTLLVLPYFTFSLPLFLLMMMLWGALSWALSPAMQNYLIESDPKGADIHQSINNSAIQVGIAIGSGIGALVIEHTGMVERTTVTGSLVVVVSLLCAIVSLAMTANQSFGAVQKKRG